MANNIEYSLGEKQRLLQAAGKSTNPMETLEYQYYKDKSGDEFTLYCRTKANLDDKILKWSFKLAEHNVSPYYKKLTMGWKPKEKKNYLSKNWARFLVAFNAEKKPVAYAMFRFDMHYDDAVLYCYEMQIEADYQRLGLGRHMMKALESCAKHWCMEKLVLTVLNNNPSAISFFKSLGYTKDEMSPDILENAEYEILSIKTLN